MENEIRYICPKCGTLHIQIVDKGTRRLLTNCQKCGTRIQVKIPVRYEYHALEAEIRTLPTVTCPKCGRLEVLPETVGKLIMDKNGKYPIKNYEYKCQGCGLVIIARIRNKKQTAKPLN